MPSILHLYIVCVPLKVKIRVQFEQCSSRTSSSLHALTRQECVVCDAMELIIMFRQFVLFLLVSLPVSSHAALINFEFDRIGVYDTYTGETYLARGSMGIDSTRSQLLSFEIESAHFKAKQTAPTSITVSSTPYLPGVLRHSFSFNAMLDLMLSGPGLRQLGSLSTDVGYDVLLPDSPDYNPLRFIYQDDATPFVLSNMLGDFFTFIHLGTPSSVRIVSVNEPQPLHLLLVASITLLGLRRKPIAPKAPAASRAL
ncbi:MAG: hypothetical protein LPK85_12875 [Gammaproteobacteria bacterium]|nr:hypothetical protein [Gammaproteobacteria bacterium]